MTPANAVWRELPLLKNIWFITDFGTVLALGFPGTV